MIQFKKAGRLAAATAIFGLVTHASFAAELKSGDVINAENFDRIKEAVFQGHTIRSLVTERMEFMIKNYGLSIRLKNSSEIPTNAVDAQNTQKYAGQAKFDPKTKEVTGYQTGLPFPDVDLGDPDAGHKALYNFYYQNTYGNSFDGDYTFLFIDAGKGVNRVQEWNTTTLKMKGRVGDSPVLEDGKLVQKTLLFAKAPYDIKGIGIFTIRHDSPQLEDNWAYIKSVRRVRRLSGGSWMDNLAGSVQLNDEYDGLSARPSWYPEAKIVGKRWILAVPHLNLPLIVKDKDGKASYPTVDTKNKPYSNPVVDWEPREVYQIEVKMPQEHPYSKRVMYMETKFPRIYMSEHYDKSEQFAKISYVFSAPTKGGEGYIGQLPWHGYTFDIKRQEAFVYLAHENVVPNRAGLKADDVTLGRLEAAAK